MQARIIHVMLHVATLYHVVIYANPNVTYVSQGSWQDTSNRSWFLPEDLCSKSTRDIMVDYLPSSTFGEVDLDEDPCLVPDCGHLMTSSSMGGCFALGVYYDVDENDDTVALEGSRPPFPQGGKIALFVELH